MTSEEFPQQRSSDGGCRPAIGRRDFLRLATASSLFLTASRMPVMAGPFEAGKANKAAIEDKKLSPEWVQSLTERGTKTVYCGTDLDKIGMPIGGIGAGQLYLGGDGRLWRWDIFNQPHPTGDGNYAHPPAPDYPVEQGFALHITAKGKTETRSLDRSGFTDVQFSGQYPIGTVTYRDANSPVSVTLEAFSPFIPLNSDDSSLPATVLHFNVHNVSKERLDVTLAGWLENAVCLNHRLQPDTRRNRILRGKGTSFLECSVERTKEAEKPPRPAIVFEDWNRETYVPWISEGEAFGTGPFKRSAIPDYQGDVGGEGERVANSHASAPGQNVQEKDSATGKLTSPKFTIARNVINVWIGGGAHKGKTCVNLVVDGKVVRSLTGDDNNRMTLKSIDVHDLQDKEAYLEIVDAESGGWGNIGVGKITFTDRPAASGKLEELPDYGTMTLALLGHPAEHAAAACEKAGWGDPQRDDASSPLAEHLTGALGRKLHLSAGQSKQVTFLVTWHFPNLEIGGLGKAGRWYTAKFSSAEAIAQYVADNFERLSSQTRLWRDTWYDSTLPYWCLDRTFLNASILATSTCYRFADGRFYAWEGVGCCPGTCTHVWHYAQAMARLFPDLERDTRGRVDFGLAFHPDSGIIGFRAEFDRSLAVDGQAGTILRAYREHQMAPDNAYLERNWPRIKKAFDPLLNLDGDRNGVLEGAQMNTLDQPWFGRVSWLSSLYVAALYAGEAMAKERGEDDFAAMCREIAERGAKQIDAQLFNGEYYQQVSDSGRGKTVGSYDGCEIDQVFGDSWTKQVGLGQILPKEHVRSALASLWKYNFLPDVGPFRAAYKPGRWYAMAGEAGLVMCSWPKGEGARVQQGFDFYFNECMTGFEYQVAGHMLAEGMVTEGLAVTRAIHDRYHASRRNPWNEVECGDHYARAMASYGVYIAACGYEHHGPKGHLGFAPRFNQDNFRAAFTTAKGWGSFSQKTIQGKTQAEILLRWGELSLTTLALTTPVGSPPKKVKLISGRRILKASYSVQDNRLLLTLASALNLRAGRKLTVKIS